MTLSLNATTAPARPAQLMDPAAADAQQTGSANSFSDALSRLEQPAVADTGQVPGVRANEKPVEADASADSHDTLPGMSQSILPMMLTLPTAIGAPVQIAQAAPDTKPASENAVPADVPSMALLAVTSGGLASGEIVEKAHSEAGKLDAVKNPASTLTATPVASATLVAPGTPATLVAPVASATSVASVASATPAINPTSSTSGMMEKGRSEADKLDAVKGAAATLAPTLVTSATSEVVEKGRGEVSKLNVVKGPASAERVEKTYTEANKQFDTALHVIPDGPASLRARDSNGNSNAAQEASVVTRVDRAGPTVADQIYQVHKMSVSAGEVQEVKQQTALAGVTPGIVTAAQVADIPAPTSQSSTIKLAAEPAQSGQQLINALKDRIQFQVEKHSEHATIRLDPPMMGRIEITVRHEAGALQVQLSATNTEVLRQLQAIGDNLRQDLVQRHYSDVSVSISDHTQDGRQQHQQEHAEREHKHAGRALAEAGQEDAAFALASDND